MKREYLSKKELKEKEGQIAEIINKLFASGVESTEVKVDEYRELVRQITIKLKNGTKFSVDTSSDGDDSWLELSSNSKDITDGILDPDYYTDPTDEYPEDEEENYEDDDED